jgi:hypothetical protein
VAEDRIRGEDAVTGRGNGHDSPTPSGWVTTQQAARALDISPRTVRWHIEQGNLKAKPEGEGVKRTWLVSIDSLQAFRDARQTAAPLPRDYRASAESADIAAESPGNAIRELADRLVEEAARASEFRVRLEISEKAQSTLEEELAGERRRREAAERERDDLRRDDQEWLRNAESGGPQGSGPTGESAFQYGFHPSS